MLGICADDPRQPDWRLQGPYAYSILVNKNASPIFRLKINMPRSFKWFLPHPMPSVQFLEWARPPRETPALEEANAIFLMQIQKAEGLDEKSSLSGHGESVRGAGTRGCPGWRTTENTLSTGNRTALGHEGPTRSRFWAIPAHLPPPPHPRLRRAHRLQQPGFLDLTYPF